MSENAATERCGRCGAAVPAGAELCPSCGALLAAYRTPLPESSSGPEPEPAVQIANPRPPLRETATAASPPAASRQAARDPALDRARAELLAMLRAPARDLATTLAEHAPESPHPAARPSKPAATPATAKAFPAPPAAAPRPLPPRPKRAATTAPSRPRRPGYVHRGTVEPVILAGATLLALSFCLVALAAAVSIRGLGVTGFVLGAVGIIAIVVALMVALVRHERERD